MSRLPLAVSALTLLLSASPALLAEDAAPAQSKTKTADAKAKDGAFRMGEVTVAVTANLDPIETANTKVTAEEIQKLNRDSLPSVLSALPGISVSRGGMRNESTFYLRGNDSRQTPVFVDGVPCFIPYDGNIDYGRFTTFDVAEVQVAKGFSSIGFGANTLGGAINVVTRKPVAELEGDVRVGIFDGHGRTAALNLGSNQGWGYVQGSLSKTTSDYWRMSSHYTPTPTTTYYQSPSAGVFVPQTSVITEDGGRRENSNSSDKRFSIKAGLTPNATDEYAIGFVRQRGSKGNPVATVATGYNSIRYWVVPDWNMDSTFLVTNTALGSASYIKSRIYFDRYNNDIFGYTNSTYSTLYTGTPSVNGIGPAMSTTGQSYYKDFSHGVMLEYGTTAIRNHSLKAILQTKTDVHREGGNTADTADTANWAHAQDRYLIVGAEDSITLSPNWDLSLGAGWDQQKPVTKTITSTSGSFWAPLSSTQSVFHGQAGLFWKVTPDTKVYATIAQKDHFATLKDRYSLKFKTYDPNPNLKAETSLNYEVGIKSNLTPWVQLEAALFESDIKNLIQAVPNALGDGKSQSQNIGKTVNKGVEFSIAVKPSKFIQGSLGYTYLDRTNKSNSQILIGTPKNRLTADLRVAPVETVYVQASVQTQSMVWDNNAAAAGTTTTYPSYSLWPATPATHVGGFTTVDMALGWLPTAAISAEAGLKNALDKNYQYSTGYPEPGRTWFANARYKF